jgi:DNA-binding ferritin-like protein (Dps family)
MFRTIVLMRKRGKLEKELNTRDLKNFNDITKYIGMSSLRQLEQEVIFQQVLDMMLQAKSEGKFASEVIGDDIKGFCDSIIEESNYNKGVFHKCFNYIEIILQTGFIYFLTISILNIIANGWDRSFKNQDVLYLDIVTFVSMFIVIFPLSFMIRRNQIFKIKKNKIDYSWVFWTICAYFIFSISDIITSNFPQLAAAHIIPYENKILLLIIFLIAFGRDICYLIKSITRKFRKK